MSFIPSIPSLNPLFQTGFLARFFEEGLDSELGYRRVALQEMLPNGVGQTITLTKAGRFSPIVTPLNASVTALGLDNGLVAATPNFEQYQYSMNQYAATANVNLLGELAGIANLFKQTARNNGVQAAQSLDRLAKNALFASYCGGNTFVRTDLGASSTTSVHVDDVRGFETLLVNGAITPVSATYPITVTEVGVGSSGVNQVFQVTAVVRDAVTSSLFPSDSPGVTGSAGASGTLTITGATSAPNNLDSLVASQAPQIVRAGQKVSTTTLAPGDVLTLSALQDATTILRNNAVPPQGDGTYHLLLDNYSMRELYADQQFMIATASKIDNPLFRDAQVFIAFGITFIPTTEAYIQNLPAAYTTTLTSGSLNVHRPILMGAECLMQGTFAGQETWLNREGINEISDVTIVDNIVHIIRPPMDRLQQIASLSWTWTGAFAVPTDLTATQSIVPSANSAAYKRCVVIEHV